MSVTIAVIIPVYNGEHLLVHALEALKRSTRPPDELIVVDDGSTDGSAALAAQYGARVLPSGRTAAGPGNARNVGARGATAEVLLFIDADCAVHSDTLARIAAHFESDAPPDAVIGTYDDHPAEKNFLSQYKNLFHAYVHRDSAGVIASFWAGCGAIDRAAFLRLGGFDAARFPRPSIEDIDLGYRLTDSGGRIILDPLVQVQHRKRWTPASLFRTDLFDRAIPWTRLLHARQRPEDNLNVQTGQKVSVVLAYLSALAAIGGLLWTPAWIAIPPAIALLLWINRDLYAFFAARRGIGFALRVFPWHLLYFGYSGLGYAIGTAAHWLDRTRQPASDRPPVTGKN